MATEQSAPIYSMRPRTRVINKLFSIESQNDNPSPDHYPNNPEQTTQSVARKYKSITYTNCRSKRFDTYGTSLRMKTIECLDPANMRELEAIFPTLEAG